MSTLRSRILGVVVAMVVPVSASAQASIAGVVRDGSGAVLPGVSVEASSPVLIEKVRTATSDGTGQYRIVDLRAVLNSNQTFVPGGTWLRPTLVLTSRFAKISATIEF